MIIIKKSIKIAVLFTIVFTFLFCPVLAFEGKIEKINDFPKRPLVFVVPYSYGGGFDTFTRNLEMSMNKLSPVPITVLNVPGAGASMAMVYTQQQENDGYTILGFEAGQLISEEKIDYKILNDFDFVAMCVLDSMQIYVKDDSPFDTFQDLINYAKENPKKIKIGANDAGGSFDFQVNYLFNSIGVEVTYVPYEGAATSGKADTLSGRVDAYWDVIGAWLSLLDAGQIRSLVTSDNNRLEAYPDIPTLKELGYDLNIGLYRGFGMKKGSPPESIEFLSKLLKLALEDPKFIEAAKNLNLKIDYTSSDEFREVVKKQKEMYLRIGKDLGYFK